MSEINPPDFFIFDEVELAEVLDAAQPVVDAKEYALRVFFMHKNPGPAPTRKEALSAFPEKKEESLEKANRGVVIF